MKVLRVVGISISCSLLLFGCGQKKEVQVEGADVTNAKLVKSFYDDVQNNTSSELRIKTIHSNGTDSTRTKLEFEKGDIVYTAIGSEDHPNTVIHCSSFNQRSEGSKTAYFLTGCSNTNSKSAVIPVINLEDK
ncbi:hypothetical protein [Kurthia zopfii]|uniref:hypothetical protein n=1 Tax=Kurthia zopfii TaxID=1650 RepID=UPI000F6FEC92|nr:hypothetical protein [Kurthia zopfii]VEI05821.1 Uncharacterised protein [Kurthia zopfii]